jgi:hypothetical protein
MSLSLLQVLESFVISWLLVDVRYVVFSPPFDVASLTISHYAKTRSGHIFSPYVPDESVTSIVVNVNLDELVLRVVEVERKREECGADDADGATLEALADTFAACTLSNNLSTPTLMSQATSQPLVAPSSAQVSPLNLQPNTQAKCGQPCKRTAHSKKMKTQARAAVH